MKYHQEINKLKHLLKSKTSRIWLLRDTGTQYMQKNKSIYNYNSKSNQKKRLIAFLWTNQSHTWQRTSMVFWPRLSGSNLTLRSRRVHQIGVRVRVRDWVLWRCIAGRRRLMVIERWIIGRRWCLWLRLIWQLIRPVRIERRERRLLWRRIEGRRVQIGEWRIVNKMGSQ